MRKTYRAMTVGCALLALSAMAAFPAHAQNVGEPVPSEATPVDPLLDLPLEDLLTLESTSVAKKRQKVADSAAAVFVISQEDIRRSAASSITDLLRMVPGVEVGNQQTGGMAVSVRGFNSRLANSLLVMIDGRSIYVSSLSGVFWDQQLIPLADIERIEVVRGPGATLWGSNAVNGVINIISKHSSDTRGIAADVRASTRRQDASLSYSGRIGEALSYRLYGNYRRDSGLTDVLGNDMSNRWQGKSLGLRIDYQPDDSNAFTLQSDYTDGAFDTPFRLVRQNLLNPGYDAVQTDNPFSDYNIVGRWVHRFSDKLDLSMQAYYDKVTRGEFNGAHIIRHLGDVDIGLHWQPNSVHDINFGIAGRIASDNAVGSTLVLFNVPARTDRWVSGYIQDDITLIPDHLRLTLGTKLEHNNITGFELQPSAKLFYRVNPSLAFWAGVSRAVRTPSRFERDTQLSVTVDLPGSAENPFPLPLYTRVSGNQNLLSEDLLAVEAGTRFKLGASWSFDIAGYYNEYRNLASADFAGVVPLTVTGVPFPVGILADLRFGNSSSAQTWGVETAISGHLKPWWKVDLTYSFMDYEQPAAPGTPPISQALFPLSGSPHHQVGLRSSIDIGDRLSLDTQIRYVDSLPSGRAPEYVDANFRLTYRPMELLELSLIGENLLKSRRLEFTQPFYMVPDSYTPRTVSVQARVRF